MELDNVHMGIGGNDCEFSQELLHWSFPGSYGLTSHDFTRPLVPDLMDCATSAFAKTGELLQDIVGPWEGGWGWSRWSWCAL